MPISADTAEHYTWGDRCDGWHLVRTPDLSIIEEHMSPGASEIRHHHIHARQFFYVLEGELTLEVEHQDHILHAGQGIEIAPGKAHQAMNRSDAPARFLVTSQPPSHGDRIASEPRRTRQQKAVPSGTAFPKSKMLCCDPAASERRAD